MSELWMLSEAQMRRIAPFFPLSHGVARVDDRRITMAIDKELLDQLLAGRDTQELFVKDGLLDELKKALSERMLAAELDDHLESETGAGAVNRRNGSSRKTVLTGSSKVTLDIPRDRSGTFSIGKMPCLLAPTKAATTGQ